LFIVTTCCKAQTPVLYGLTSAGGTLDTGVIFSYNIATGVETVQYNLPEVQNGAVPRGTLFQASNGLLYGTTSTDGLSAAGGNGYHFQL